jgi:hypothetical protein
MTVYQLSFSIMSELSVQYVFSVNLSRAIFLHHGVGDLFDERVASLLTGGV